MSLVKMCLICILSLFLLSFISIRAQNSEQYLQGIETLNNKDTLKAIDYFNSSVKRNRDKESYWELAKIFNTYEGVDDLFKARIMVKKTIEKDELFYKHKFGIFYKDTNFNDIFSIRDSISSLSINDEIISGSKKYAVNSILILSKPEQINLAFEIIREKIKVFLHTAANFAYEKAGAIQRGNYKILPNPTDTFDNKDKPFIYHEIYNLKKDKNNLTSFEQEITVTEAEDNSELSDVINSFLDVIGFDSKGKEITLSSKYNTIENDPQIPST